MPTITPTEQEAHLTAAFNAQFKTTLTFPVIQKLLGSPHVRDWYSVYRSHKAAAQSLPDHWAEAGLTADEWKGTQGPETARRKIRADSQAKLSAAAEQYKIACEAVNAEADLGLRALETPLVLAVEGGYEQLTLAAQARIEAEASPEKRKERMDVELSAARKVWVKAARAGKAPF